MPFDPLVTAIIETSLNARIKDEPQLVDRLARLKGQVIQVHLKELNKTLTFVFSHQIDVLAKYDATPNCYLSLQLAVIPQLSEQANITQLIKQEKLELEGDIQLAQKFSQFLIECKPDFEEWLSRLTGDVVAHTLVQGALNVGEFVKRQATKHQNQIAEVLTEEWKLAPAPLEIADFCDQVDEVKSHSARLEARLNQLLERA